MMEVANNCFVYLFCIFELYIVLILLREFLRWINQTHKVYVRRSFPLQKDIACLPTVKVVFQASQFNYGEIKYINGSHKSSKSNL